MDRRPAEGSFFCRKSCEGLLFIEQNDELLLLENLCKPSKYSSYIEGLIGQQVFYWP